MSDKRYQDKETLIELYHEKGMSQSAISDELGCSRGTIKYWLDKHDIKRRPPPKDRPPKLSVDPQGRERFASTSGGKQDSVLHHRLLAALKYGVGEMRGKIVHHKNGISWDNRPDNLELVTRKEHQRHHFESGDIGKLDPEDVRDIRERYRSDERSGSIAPDYDITPEFVHLVAIGESYDWVPDPEETHSR
jgi:transposase